MHSFSTSTNSHQHTRPTVLNADVPNCYTTLKVVIWNKLSNDLINSQQTKCGLFSRIISSYNSSVQNCQNLCSKCAPCTNCLKIEWSRNVLLAASQRWRRKREAAFTAWLEHVTVQGLKGLKCALLSAIFGVEFLSPKTVILIITALCNNLEHLRLTR